MGSIVNSLDVGIFILGLAFGAGLVLSVIAIQEQRHLRTLPPPLQLAPVSNTGTDATTAQIPPSPTVMHEPVYLSDADVVRLEGVRRGTIKPSGETIEATKVGA